MDLAGLSLLREQLGRLGPAARIDPHLLLTTQLLIGVRLTPLIDAIPAFGGELGWRS